MLVIKSIFSILETSLTLKAKWQVALICVILSTTSLSLAEEAPTLPAVTVEEETEIIPTNTPEEVIERPDPCKRIIVNQDIENRYKKIQDALEADYAQGMPKQIKTDLIRVRKDIDGLIVKLFEVDTNNNQEVNHIAQLAIDYLEKMISLVPKANRIAPRVRDQFVIPFTNISSIKADYQECLMKAAVEEARSKPLAANDEPSINVYRKLTTELERLNNNLYTLQTTDVQKFISLRSKIMRRLERYNKTNENAIAVTGDLPQILNGVHRDIETLIPGLELSKDYLTVAH